MKSNIIIVEDNFTYIRYIENFLKSKGLTTTTATTIAKGKELITKADSKDIVLCDYRFEKSDGLELLKWMNAEGYTNPFILMTQFDMWNTATEAIKLGAVDYIPKHYLDENIMEMFGKIWKRQELTAGKKSNILRRKSEAFQQLYKKIAVVAKTNMPVLILGESGTGKEHIAKMIHEQSKRWNKPFESANCACFTDELAESELFGHELGAFTHALKKRIGRFELADKGTIFLDEVGTLTQKVQQILLRILQEGTFRTVGDVKDKHVDVRVIAATNEDLKVAIAEKRFREDLYFRLKEVVLTVPPLRDCKEDIIPLAEHFVKEFNEEEKTNACGFDDAAKKLLLSYSWPGNVRELRQIVRVAALNTGEGLITADSLDIEDDSQEIANSFEERRKQISKEELEWALKETGGNRREACKRLGVCATTFYKRMKECGIPLKE